MIAISLISAHPIIALVVFVLIMLWLNAAYNEGQRINNPAPKATLRKNTQKVATRNNNAIPSRRYNF